MTRQPKATAKENYPPILFRWNWWTLPPLALAVSAMVAPALLTHGIPVLGLSLERGFAIVCHQRPERSFLLFGSTVAVCSRCFGIYLGAAAGLLLRTSRTIAVRLLMIAAALNLSDVATELARWHGNWLGVRFTLGLLLGATGALLISSSSPASSQDRDGADAGSWLL
jgi:uncharacterized membrane protein